MNDKRETPIRARECNQWMDELSLAMPRPEHSWYRPLPARFVQGWARAGRKDTRPSSMGGRGPRSTWLADNRTCPPAWRSLSKSRGYFRRQAGTRLRLQRLRWYHPPPKSTCRLRCSMATLQSSSPLGCRHPLLGQAHGVFPTGHHLGGTKCSSGTMNRTQSRARGGIQH